MRHWRGSRSSVERAVEIARLGPATSLEGLRALLSQEGREEIDASTSGMLIKAQLNRLIEGRPTA